MHVGILGAGAVRVFPARCWPNRAAMSRHRAGRASGRDSRSRAARRGATGDFTVRTCAESDAARVGPVDLGHPRGQDVRQSDRPAVLRRSSGRTRSCSTLQNGVDSADEVARVVGEPPSSPARPTSRPPSTGRGDPADRHAPAHRVRRVFRPGRRLGSRGALEAAMPPPTSRPRPWRRAGRVVGEVHLSCAVRLVYRRARLPIGPLWSDADGRTRSRGR